MRRLRFAVTIAAMLTTSACSGAPPATPVTIEGIRDVRADVARDPAGSAQQLSAIVAADRAFAFALYRELVATESGNLFYSPYSISTALSMTYAGARAQTAAQLAAALGIDADSNAWHAGRNALEQSLAAQRPVASGLAPLRLEPTNGIFGQDGYPFEAEFLRTLAADYGAGLQAVDFVTRAEAARGLINAWVKARTQDRIPELLPDGAVDSMTVLVLVNAIYFKGMWEVQFDPKLTDQQPFTLLGGTQVNVDLMHGRLEADYTQGDGWQAVRLPYAGDASMLVLVPDGGQFERVEGMLDAGLIGQIRSASKSASVTLDLPRWKSASAIDLIPTLKALGVTDIFDAGAADLSGIATVDQLYVSAVLHQANVTVDEQGTEAAAATAVVVGRTSAPALQVHLTVDRPFIYLVTDDITGEVLFVGRVLDPTAG